MLKTILVRSLSGFIFVAIVIAALLNGIWATGALFLIFSIIGLNEYYKLLTNYPSSKPNSFLGMVIGIFSYALIFLWVIGEIDAKYILLILPFLSLVFIVELFQKKGNVPMFNIGSTFLGLLYIVIPFSIISIIANHDGIYNYEIPLGALLLIWLNDTAAFLSGSFFGKHKLFERVSPKKTWEGFIGGIVFSLVGAYILSLLFESLDLTGWMVIALIVSIIGTLGDLVESQLKRTAHVKDSGKLMPGHGGVLDRFDSLLFSLPVILFFLLFWVW